MVPSDDGWPRPIHAIRGTLNLITRIAHTTNQDREVLFTKERARQRARLPRERGTKASAPYRGKSLRKSSSGSS